jgi:hypothetical protein
LGTPTFHTVHIFFVLPEPLDLPPGFAVQRLDEPGTYTGESLRVWDGSDLTVDDLLAGPFCRFTSRTTAVDIGATTAAVDFARVTWPTLPRGPGEATAAEPGAEGSGALTPPERVQTCVEIVQAVGCQDEDCSGELDDQVFEDVLRHGLRTVQALQKSVYVISRQSYTLVTQSSIASATPVGLGRIAGDRFTQPDTLTVWLANVNLLSELPPYDLSDSDLAGVAALLQHVDRRTFFGYLDFQREAAVAYRRRGDNRSAAIFTGLACERLLDDLLAHLLWEEGARPETAPATFMDQQGITQRVRREFHPRLKGFGSTDQPGPVGDWWQKVAKLRNQVVHGAYTPTDQEIEDAIGAANALVTYIGDCLADRVKQEGKYRLTALALLGEGGMKRRDIWTRRSKDAAKRFDDEDLWSLAARWKAAAERQRAIGFGDHVHPDESIAYVLYVVHSAGPPYWVQHDRVASQARLIGEPTDLSPGQRLMLSTMERAAREVAQPGDDYALATVMEVDLPAKSAVLGDWVEEYQLMPQAEVMVDGSDRRAVTTSG